MGRKEIVIYEYECDICNFSSKNPNAFFEIFGKIINGDGTKEYLLPDGESIYLCKTCLFKILEDKTTQNLNTKKQKEIKSISENTEGNNQIDKKINTSNKIVEEDDDFYITVDGFGSISKKNVQTILKKYKLKCEENDIVQITEVIEEFLNTFIKNNQIDALTKVLEKYFDNVIYSPPETPKQVDKVTEFPSNCYIIFKRIDSDKDEKEVAKKFGFVSIDALRASFGSELKDKEIYYITNMYIENRPEQYDGYYDKIKYIDGLIFGTVNIKETECFVEDSGKHCFIERNVIKSF